jgi:large subunit ribosomal protein L22
LQKKKLQLLLKNLSSQLSQVQKNGGMDINNLIVKEITVNSGATLMRRRPMSRGRAFPIRKRVSSIFVALAAGPEAKVKATKAEKAAKKAEKIKS